MNALMSDSAETHSPTQLVVLGAPVDPLVGREVGGYVIEFALGEGGMGLVYQARHPFLDRRFAIKVLRPEFAADLQLSSNFVREAQTLSALKHPHIIDIVGFGPLDDQRQFMVMEFLDGRTLEAELAEEGALSVRRVLALSDQILDALEGAHSIDVIHRDLKPSNVFLSRVSGGTEVVKLLDFGLAKFQPQVLVGSKLPGPPARSVAAGTPDYVAPEQAVGGAVSRLSDLYSFGVVLFELLRGRKLFIAPAGSMDPVRELLLLHVSAEAPRLGDAFPEELEQLVAELLKKDPTQRPQSVKSVRERLQRMGRRLQGEETRQAVNPLLEPILERPPRKAWPLVLGVGALVLLGVALWPRELPVAAPLPGVVATPAPAPAPGVPLAVLPEELEDLTPLPSSLINRPSARRPVKPVAELAQVAPVSSVPGCEPTERWRAASRAHLQELQQLAASGSNAALWARFEDAEATLTSAIGKASTSADCAAAEKRIHQLAKELSP